MRKTTFSMTDEEYFVLLCQRIYEAGANIAHDFKDYIQLCLICVEYGADGREWYHKLSSLDEKYDPKDCDFRFDNCTKTTRHDIKLGTLVDIAKKHGIDTSKPRGRRVKDDAQKQEEQRSIIEQAIELLHSWAQWWYNLWSERVEILEPEAQRRPVNDRDLSTYYIKLKQAGVKINAKDVEHLIKSREFAPDDNPFQNYFDALPEWHEGDTDYIREFFIEHMEFGDPENTEFYDLIFHRFFVGMVGLWLGYRDENPIVPVLYGEQRIGKTYFVRHILPPELQSYLFPVNPAARIDKDFEIAMSETPIMFLDEFNVTNFTKSEAYKYAATSSKSYLRDSYGHFREMRSRRASLIGATNHERFIREAEGDRRWLAVNLKGTTDLNEHPLPYSGAYAQALYLLNHGYQTKPSREESQMISDHNQPFVMTDDTAEALLTFVRKPTATSNAEAYSAGDLLKELNTRGFHGRNFSTVAIGRAMKSLGFEAKKVRGTYKYCIILADYDTQKRERIEDADDGIEVF